MDFRTVVGPVAGLKGLVRHGEPVMLVGSCFSDNIGTCLRDELFEADVNPFGPLYNPVSICNAFLILKDREIITKEELFERDDRWHSFHFHSRFSGSDIESALARMNGRIAISSENLRRASTVIVTLGTNRTFVSRKFGITVANCHKLPAGEFEEHYLSVEEATQALDDTRKIIREVNPDAFIVFTVSPLRYSEKGAHGNQLSKAVLMLAIDSVLRAAKFDRLAYFPAYEVMMDDLRDYRFYAEDMKHPSQQAVRYIYDLFRETFFDEETLMIASQGAALSRRLSHRSTRCSAEEIEREYSEKKIITEDFTARFPELKRAADCYLFRIFNDGI